MPVFRHREEFDHPVEALFAYHRHPGAFERLSPPWERVTVVRREGGIEPGGRVDLRLHRGPARLLWSLEHGAYEENRLFTDEQVGREGPFQSWRHEHRFSDLGQGRSALEDVIHWELPLRPLGTALGGPMVESDLRRLFRFRAARLTGDLSLLKKLPRPLTVAITGSTGLVGRALCSLLTVGGHRVLPVVRGRAGSEGAGAEVIRWDPKGGTLEAEKLEGVDAVVHLAGEPIVGPRWTEAKKESIRQSRVKGTALLAQALAGLERPPSVFISGSAVGFYGSRGDELLTEASPGGEGFLAEVCQAWEAAAHPAVQAGIRTVFLRTGIVLSPEGGVLGSMLLPFRLGVGGRLGSGRQFMPWIDLDDELGLILHALSEPTVSGPLNATAPTPVTNAEFTRTLGQVLGRPTILPVPAPAIRGLLGEMGEALLLEGQRVTPTQAEATGYSFLRSDLEDSLRTQLGRLRGG